MANYNGYNTSTGYIQFANTTTAGTGSNTTTWGNSSSGLWVPEYPLNSKPMKFVGGALHGQIKKVPVVHDRIDVPVMQPFPYTLEDSGKAAEYVYESYDLIHHKGESFFVLRELWEAERPAVGFYKNPNRDEYHIIVVTTKPGILGFSITRKMYHALMEGQFLEQFHNDLKEVKMGDLNELIYMKMAERYVPKPVFHDAKEDDEPVPEKWELDEEELGDPVMIPAA